MPLVELKHVGYRYEDSSVQALDNVSLEINTAEYVLLAGASGSGKSTLCRLLNGLIPHFHGGLLEGSVRVDGLETRAHSVWELFAHAGLVFQNPEAQLFNSTVEREIIFGLESLGLAQDEIQSRANWALDVARIGHFRKRAPNTLSGGEQQIVAVAAMLALRPRVLALDEPFANLDPEAVLRLQGLLRDMHRRGTLVIVAEHRLSAAIQDVTRLIILERGRLVRDGAPRDILREDITLWGLEAPYVVRAAQAGEWDEIPLSVKEAATIAAHNNSLVLSQRPHTLTTDRPNTDPAFRFENVAFRHTGMPVLTSVNLTCYRGESIALVGRNGSGKTTLLKHLIGIYRPTAGSVRVFDLDTRRAGVSDIARHVGFVFQNPNDQLFKPNVKEELEVAPRSLNRQDQDWMDRLIGWFDLDHLLVRSPFTLSEGEKKRVAFAATLAARPSIVVLDEPTTGQDFYFRLALERLLNELRAQGATIILATHDLEFAERVAPRWVVLADGSIVLDGTPDSVMHDEAMLGHAGLRATARVRLKRELLAYREPMTAAVENGSR